jgi:hypothetical protein
MGRMAGSKVKIWLMVAGFMAMMTWLMVSNTISILHFRVNISALWYHTVHAENGIDPQFFNANPIGQNGGYDLNHSIHEVCKELSFS